MRKLTLLAAFCVCSTIASAQVFEGSVSGGVSRFGNSSLITVPNVTLGNGFRLTFRMTLNTYRFFGHEFGYGYNRSTVDIAGPQGGSLTMPVHQGFYNFLLYGTPEGSRIRPFATGGVHFSSFVPPGASVYYGNQVTKFDFNYGGGLKVRVTGPWGVRFDVRQYNTGKPDLFQTTEAPSGRLLQTEISAGISFNL